MNLLLFESQAWPHGQRPSLVGRLDKHTSGALVVAKTTEAHSRLQRSLASSFSEKAYLAVVYGPVTRERGIIDLRLRRHPDDRRRVSPPPIRVSRASRDSRRLDQVDLAGCEVALMRCRLASGRMHHIRVHLAASGWPIVGDAKYGEPRWERTVDPGVIRARLAAFRDRRSMPGGCRSNIRSRVSVSIEAPVPDDLRELMTSCGLELETG